MFGLGITEIIFLAVLALIVIGPKQLPEMARTIGRFLNELKRSTDALKDDIKIKVDLDLEKRRSDMGDQIRKQQEQLREREKTTGLPLPEEDRPKAAGHQLTIEGFEKESSQHQSPEPSKSSKGSHEQS